MSARSCAEFAATLRRALEAVGELERPPAAAPPPAAPAELFTRDQLRSRRKRTVRSKTVNMQRFGKRDLMVGAALYPDTGDRKPETRAGCVDGPRPCPFVSCKHHLYLDVTRDSRSLKLNFPDLAVDEMTESCVLDVTDRGPQPLEKVADLMNITRERVRQIEVRTLVKVERLVRGRMPEYVPEGA